MARYCIVGWKGIPAAVEASDADGAVRVALSPRFQELIDAVAMRTGAADADDYLEGWSRSAEVERDGTAEAVARAIAAELEAGFAALVARHRPGAPG